MSRVTYPVPTPDDAAMLLDWRTRPEITRHMFTDIEPDLARQRRWLEDCAYRPGFLHRLIAFDGVPVGYCSITTIDNDARIGSIGVYIVDMKARTGPAGLNFIQILNHAFFPLGLLKIENKIMGANARLARAQQHNGYREVGVLRRHAWKYGALHDVHLFEMLREDWLSFRERFRDYRDLDGVETARRSPRPEGNPMTISDYRKPDHAIDPVFIERWSPRAFTNEPVPDSVLLTCFEAARWAPSSMNAQPWRFLYSKKGSPSWDKFQSVLLDRARAWTHAAAALIVFAADRTLVIGGKGIPSPTHAFDTGAAWQNFALQAIRLGWHTHGIASFDRETVNGILGIPEGFTVYAVAAIGKIGDKSTLPDSLREREFPSDRRPVGELAFEGGWRD